MCARPRSLPITTDQPRTFVTTHSMELLPCSEYGCPGCEYRHFHRTSDDARLTEVPDVGLYTAAQLAALGRVAMATGALTVDR
jgi:hypothetical protein